MEVARFFSAHPNRGHIRTWPDTATHTALQLSRYLAIKF